VLIYAIFTVIIIIHGDNMAENYQIDKTDKEILTLLLNDARTPFIEIARKLIVSGGTIHQRVDKMKQLGIIEGSCFRINLSKMGYDVTVFLGIHLRSSKDTQLVIEKLNSFDEVVEAYFTTGSYALLVKVHTKTITDFHHFLANKLQSIDSIQATESFISLNQPIKKSLRF
jgi:Lrp/AsnC family transcriptional regulator for asnA, asnC and gidA